MIAFFIWVYGGLRIIPSLVQLTMLEILGTACLGAGFAARMVDMLGYSGHPPIAQFTWSLFIWALVGLGLLWFVFRDIWHPAVKKQRWAPVRHAGPVSFVLPNDPSATSYAFLGSHPSYVLMDMVAGFIPAFMTYLTWEDDPVHNPVKHVHITWFFVWLMVPIFRLFSWYVLRRGPEVVGAIKAKIPERDRGLFEWRTFWSGPLAFWLIALTAVIPGVYFGHRDLQRVEANTPALNAAVRGDRSVKNDTRFRLRGTLTSELKEWPRENGRYEGAAFVVRLQDGGEAIVFVKQENLKAVRKLVSVGVHAPVTCLVRTLGDGASEIPEHYIKYFNWVPAELSANLSTAVLTIYVDP